MKSSNCTEIRQAFARQAAGFESGRMSFSKQEYLDYIVQKAAPEKTDQILETAAGTCACGRALAPYVQSVVCLDMTPAMLAVGKGAAEQAGLDNMKFVLGDAAEMPFPDSSFTMVLSRLAFHHFPCPERSFAEMTRVLKPGGKLILIDMEAAEGPLRETEDEIERMRDPSHVRNLSRGEMLALYSGQGLAVETCEMTRIPVELQSWLELTKTPQPLQQEIFRRFEAELAGGAKTGFSLYRTGEQIRFDQRWTLLIGRKIC